MFRNGRMYAYLRPSSHTVDLQTKRDQLRSASEKSTLESTLRVLRLCTNRTSSQ
jgi:hypothetical protein